MIYLLSGSTLLDSAITFHAQKSWHGGCLSTQGLWSRVQGLGFRLSYDGPSCHSLFAWQRFVQQN